MAPAGGGTASPSVSLSTFGPPFAVVAVARTMLLPAFRFAVMLAVCQVSHVPVPGNARFCATRVPLTVMSIGRLVVVPLANRKVREGEPPAAAVTVHSTELPATLS